MFSQVFVHSQGVPQSRVLFYVTGPTSFPGVAQSWSDGGTSFLAGGIPVLAGGTQVWGTPSQDKMGYPLCQNRIGYPTGQHCGTLANTGLSPSAQNNRVSTCYTVGSMPPLFMQEDFLVVRSFKYFFGHKILKIPNCKSI